MNKQTEKGAWGKGKQRETMYTGFGCAIWIPHILRSLLRCHWAFRLKDCYGPPLVLIHSGQYKVGAVVSSQYSPCSRPAQAQGDKVHGGQPQKLSRLDNTCLTRASISYSNSIGTASRVLAVDTPVTRVTPFRDDQGTLSPPVIYSSLIVFPIQIQFTGQEWFFVFFFF